MSTTDPTMTAYILSTGVMECDYTWLLLKAGSTIVDRNHKDQPARWDDCPTHAVLVEHPEGRLLWDTGVPRDWQERWAPTGFDEFFPVREDPNGSGYLDTALGQLELTVDDIDVLILSHLHFDHAANAKMFDPATTRILAHADEIAGAMAIDGYSKGAHIVSDYQDLKLEAISGDTEIWPGVSVIETPGHTWGTMSLRLDLAESGTMLFTSDAVYLGESWGPPPIGAGIVWDSVQWLESVEKLRAIAEQSDATVIFGHDPKQRATLNLAPTGRYT